MRGCDVAVLWGVLVVAATLPACAGAPTARRTTRGGLATRAGARRLAAYVDQRRWVRREGDPDLRMGRLQRRLRGRPGGARVRQARVEARREAQTAAAEGDLAFDVQRGGEIVALALAEQLEVMGLRVGLEPNPDDPQADIERYPPVDLRGLRFLVLLEGEARFWVRAEHAASGPARSTAEVHATVRVHALRKGEATLIHTASAQRSATVDARAVPTRSARARAAGREALDAWVRAVLLDPKFEEALLTQVR